MPCRRYDCADVALNVIVSRTLEEANIDHHVDLRRTIAHRLLRLTGFYFRRRRSEQKSHHRAHHHRRVFQQLEGHRHVAGLHAYRRKAVPARIIAYRANLALCRLRFQRRVVDQTSETRRKITRREVTVVGIVGAYTKALGARTYHALERNPYGCIRRGGRIPVTRLQATDDFVQLLFVHSREDNAAGELSVPLSLSRMR